MRYIFLFFALLGALGAALVGKYGGPTVVGWVQRAVGILPEDFNFGSCSMRPRSDVVVYAVRYKDGGRVWSFGLLPSWENGAPDDLRFEMLASGFDVPEVVFSRLTDQQVSGIRSGAGGCVSAGDCEAIPNVFGSGRVGLQMGTQYPQYVVVPDLALSVTLYKNEVSWLRCVDG